MRRLATVCILAAGCLVGCGNDKTTQQTTAPAVTVAVPPDHQAGKITAEKHCASCHGMNGVGTKNGAPFLAGQPLDYLVGALRGYSEGTRTHDDMKAALSTLDETERLNVAGYYQQLDTPWKAPVVAPPSVDKAAVAAGEAKAKPCTACHGVDGNSTLPGMPSLALLEPEYLRKALKDYLTDARDDPLMRNFKHALNDNDVKNLAAYFASLTPKPTTLPVPGNAKLGERAAQICAGCHGAGGNSQVPSLPSIAGQNAAYLTKAINAYRSGARKNAMMQNVVANLGDATVVNIAAYFARQTPAKLAAAHELAIQAFDPIGDGARIATTCNACHGAGGNSATTGIPSLSRQSPEYLAAAINAYKQGTRTHSMMQTLASFLTATDMEKVGLYYATQAPTATKMSGKGDMAAGEKLAAACNGCHGEHGNSAEAKTPSLAGQDPTYIASALRDYAAAKRSNADMQNVAKPLTPEDISNVARYYAAQTPVKPVVRMPESPEVLAGKCDRCHGDKGFSTLPGNPRLAGQRETYLVKALQAYQTDARSSTAMHAMSDVLSLTEVHAIAAHYARQ